MIGSIRRLSLCTSDEIDQALSSRLYLMTPRLPPGVYNKVTKWRQGNQFFVFYVPTGCVVSRAITAAVNAGGLDFTGPYDPFTYGAFQWPSRLGC